MPRGKDLNGALRHFALAFFPPSSVRSISAVLVWCLARHMGASKFPPAPPGSHGEGIHALLRLAWQPFTATISSPCAPNGACQVETANPRGEARRRWPPHWPRHDEASASPE